MDIKRSILIAAFLTCALASPVPQVQVQEVRDPEVKRQILNCFNGRSGLRLQLCLSLFPETRTNENVVPRRQGQVVDEVVVVVQSPALQLRKPKNPERKLREKAERRTADRPGN